MPILGVEILSRPRVTTAENATLSVQGRKPASVASAWAHAAPAPQCLPAQGRTAADRLGAGEQIFTVGQSIGLVAVWGAVRQEVTVKRMPAQYPDRGRLRSHVLWLPYSQ